MSMIKLVDTDKYVRDAHSKALISTDKSARAAYKIKKQKSLEMEQCVTDINNLRNEMCEIKDILQQILINQGRGA